MGALDNFRKKYPQYNDIDDVSLGNMLADKYPEAYGDLRVSETSVFPGIDRVVQRQQERAPLVQPFIESLEQLSQGGVITPTTLIDSSRARELEAKGIEAEIQKDAPSRLKQQAKTG